MLYIITKSIKLINIELAYNINILGKIEKKVHFLVLEKFN